MSTENIKLNFINQSNDQNNSSVVIFQQNVAPGYDELAVAWRVIENCGRGDNHPFTYPMTFQIGYCDSWGNHTPHLYADPGQQFSAVRNGSGDVIELTGSDAPPEVIELHNALPQGAIDARIYKDGKLLALKTGLAPQQKADFQFEPTLWIGAVSQIEEGETIAPEIAAHLDTRLSLIGIVSADIVMSGGGPGPQSLPFEFSLQNVVMG